MRLIVNYILFAFLVACGGSSSQPEQTSVHLIYPCQDQDQASIADIALLYPSIIFDYAIDKPNEIIIDVKFYESERDLQNSGEFNSGNGKRLACDDQFSLSIGANDYTFNEVIVDGSFAYTVRAPINTQYDPRIQFYRKDILIFDYFSAWNNYLVLEPLVQDSYLWSEQVNFIWSASQQIDNVNLDIEKACRFNRCNGLFSGNCTEYFYEYETLVNDGEEAFSAEYFLLEGWPRDDSLGGSFDKELAYCNIKTFWSIRQIDEIGSPFSLSKVSIFRREELNFFVDN